MATAAKKKPVRSASKRATPPNKTAPARGAAPAPPVPPAKAAKDAKPLKTAEADEAGKAGKAPKKADKPKKPKLVRDSFTIPKTEYAVLDQLKARAAKAGKPAKKSELLRAGIQALAGMQDGALLAALAAVPALKTGRPAKG